ncbi:hypothetical protein [Absidia glauca]|uniref:Reverse transcriptase domain-containing protein n=1 Tax=Absidia glauca TaxID=4829 RepID=A0A168MZD5_ABSGL|nr:hypothetical protein [Absidia glauca]
MKHEVILGWDSIRKLNGIIDSATNSVTLRQGCHQQVIPLKVPTSVNSLATTHQDLAIREVINRHASIIPENTKRPSVTHLMKFTFDLLPDTQPIFIPPRRMHPTLQASLDQELESLYALTSLGSASIFSKLDLASGYWQIPVHEDHMDKTTLSSRSGLYQFTVMPFGLVNAPAFFQVLMMKTLGSLNWSCCIAYMDDIIIYSKSYAEHIIHLDQVLSALQQANLSIKPSKCQFGLASVEYLGFIATAQGIKSDPQKVAPILHYPTPTNLTNEEYVWGPDQATAFAKVKQQLMVLPTLRQPDFQHDFELHSDAASKYGIAVILCQRYDNHPYPLAFASRSVSSAEANYSIQELEALAIVWAFKRFHCYLQFSVTKVFTDHSSLKWLAEAKDNVQGRIWRWSTPKLQQQDSHIQTLMMSMKKAKCPEGLKRTHTVANDLLFHIIPATRKKARNRLPLVSSPPSTTSLMEFNPHQDIDNMTSTLDLAYNNTYDILDTKSTKAPRHTTTYTSPGSRHTSHLPVLLWHSEEYTPKTEHDDRKTIVK